jgi:hypothetical protein
MGGFVDMSDEAGDGPPRRCHGRSGLGFSEPLRRSAQTLGALPDPFEELDGDGVVEGRGARHDRRSELADSSRHAHVENRSPGSDKMVEAIGSSEHHSTQPKEQS